MCEFVKPTAIEIHNSQYIYIIVLSCLMHIKWDKPNEKWARGEEDRK